LETNENPITCYQSKPCVNIETRIARKGSTIKAVTVVSATGEKGRIPAF
jgi:hypothetical protein